jgi:hypothetical protein
MRRVAGIGALAFVLGMALWLLARERPRPEAAKRLVPSEEAPPTEGAPELVPTGSVREAIVGASAASKEWLASRTGAVTFPIELKVSSGQTILIPDEPTSTVERVADVPIAGVLHVPMEWELESFQLELRPLDEPRSSIYARSELLPSGVIHVSGGSGSYRALLGSEELVELPHAPGYFHFSMQGQPGRYELFLPELAHRESFDVGPQGRTDLRIEAPLPRVVLARCYEAANGAALVPPRVGMRWSGSAREGGQIHRAAAAVWKEEVQAWRILAPTVDLDLSAFGEGYFDARVSVPVAEGTSEVRLELAASFELRLELRENGKLKPWNVALRPRLVPAGGQPDHVTVGIGATSCRLVQRAGGAYSLEVDTPQGYRPILPVIVELDGPRTEHVIELVRLP